MATLRYPANIESLAAYMILVRYKHGGYGGSADTLRNPEKFQMKNTIGSAIGLPIPSAITDSTNLIWRDETDASVFSTLVGAAGNRISPKAVSEIQKAAGSVMEKHNAMVFSGVAPKTYSFSWDIAPRNSAEAKTVIDIANELADASLPTLTAGGECFNFPDMLNIEVVGLNNVHYLPVIINSVNIGYAPDGLFQVYTDGYVPNMKLSLSLTEIASRNRSVNEWLRT